MMNGSISFEDVMTYLNNAANMGQLERSKREQIVSTLRWAQEREGRLTKRALAVGMKVQFPAKGGGTVTGTVSRILPKNVEVRADGSGPFSSKWRCSPQILTVI